MDFIANQPWESALLDQKRGNPLLCGIKVKKVPRILGQSPYHAYNVKGQIQQLKLRKTPEEPYV